MLSSNTSAVSGDATYIEDVFSTYLYTGNGSTQTITNNIDLSTKGGMTWIKSRSAAENNCLFDTARGVNKYLLSSTTDAQLNFGSFGVTAFNTNGFAVTGGSGYAVDTSGATYSSWTFRKQPKFFDVVTYTGDGVYGREISHALGSTPGCMFIKATSTSNNWNVYHRAMDASYPASYGAYLNLIDPRNNSINTWANTAPTSTVFTVGTDNNANGVTYVAYLFAHNAGGFGLTGTDNVISCGSYTGNGSTSGPSITLGYEPQYVLIKDVTSGGYWMAMDTQRSGMLYPNTSDTEVGTPYWLNVGGDNLLPTATGFKINTSGTTVNANGSRYIYMAIRRGPMKVPTDATKVFANSFNGPVSNVLAYLGQPTDFWLRNVRSGGTHIVRSRLIGQGNALYTDTTASQNLDLSQWWDNQTGVAISGNTYSLDSTIINYLLQRAPSFFDAVYYTGTGSSLVLNHNLGVAPELAIFKSTSTSGTNWAIYCSEIPNQYLYLNLSNAASSGFSYLSAASATTMTLPSDVDSNTGGRTYVAYLFATCAGVSKVGSYSGTGATQTINCGFTGGARFVLIKRTDASGHWYVWDATRGMVAGTDPSLQLNNTTAEVNANSIYTTTGGFQIVSTASGINASGGTYIYLAIA